MDKQSKPQKPGAPAAAVSKTPAAPASPSRVPPLFQSIDWIAMAFTFAVVWIVYFLTLAPNQTLEDSGELCTAAFYAGIPHPPGYPFWTIYAWLWTELLPIGNVAWRVEVGQSMAAAFACGLVALVVCRGARMLMEGIDELKNLKGKWETAICLVSGIVSGLLLGFGAVMWSESVVINRISLFGVPGVMIVLTLLLRWIYAPHQLRYLYLAMFCFGICATIHQTLLVAAIGIEIAIAVARPRLGRSLFLGNSIIYFLGMIAQETGFITLLNTAFMLLLLFNIVGIGSIAAYIWFAIVTRESFKELCRDAAGAAFLILALLAMSKGVGVGLLATVAFGAFVYLAWETRKLGLEWAVAIVLGLVWAAGAAFYFYEPIAGMTNPPMQWGYPRTVEGFFHALSRGQYEKANPTDLFGDPQRFKIQLGMLVGDIAGEFNWVAIFIALVPLLFFRRMQKRERAWILGLTGTYFCIGVLLVILMNPSPERQSADLIKVFFISSHSVVAVLFGYGLVLSAAYMATHYQRFRVPGLILAAVMLVPAFLTLYVAVSRTFFGVVDPVPARNVFFMFLCLVGAFVLAALAGQSFIRLRLSNQSPAAPQRERWFIAGYIAAALACLAAFISRAFFREAGISLSEMVSGLGRVFAPHQYRLPVVAGLIILSITLVFIASLLLYRRRAPLAITLGLFALMPLASGLAHWAGAEQRNHWFGYWFGHDMFTPPFNDTDGKPLYPEMARDTILFGGTDPGRFCPTYMIFCESFIPHECQELDQKFDRRDVYLITQNALADGTYLNYLRAQYFRSQQIDPPFFSELARFILKDKEYETNLLARLVSPLDTYFMARGARIEKRWRTESSLFKPGHFLDLQSFTRKLTAASDPDPVSRWLYDNLEEPTRQLLKTPTDEKRLRSVLADDLNRLLERELQTRNLIAEKQREKSAVDQALLEDSTPPRLRQRQEELAQQLQSIKIEPLYEPARFAHVKISDYLKSFIAQNPLGDTRIRLNRLLLEAAYPAEITNSLGGVYPDREIYIPSNEDSQLCFQDYLNDASRRLMHDQQFPNEPKQVKPGENVNFEGGKVQVNGQVAVMSINGLLCKVIFDKNPQNEFYIEESFPLDWMYPHLTPFGIIMKINRQPLRELSDDIVRRDHEFWSQYSERMIGNWITYDTPVKEIVDWIEKVYLRHDLSEFKGDRKFIRDEQAQKAFSKLRSSIAGIYAWRVGMATSGNTPREYLAKTDAERARMVREADFALRQAFAYCPYSPEAVFRYVQLLMGMGRLDDARMVAATCQKLDPENGQVNALVQNLEEISRSSKAPAAAAATFFNQIEQMEAELRTNPNNFQIAFELAAKYMQAQRPDRTIQLLDGILDNPNADLGMILSVVNAYSTMNNFPKLEHALERLVQVAPDQPEGWFDLAAIKTRQGKLQEALDAARKLLELNSSRLARDPKAHDLSRELRTDPQFATLRAMPEFKALLQQQR